ncbi:sensor histidine kinase, putative [Heliomicrobium modesticaldum Ice1]|uniref:histidine kinase n=1 Tax=Heliobacterium modesticaldum (strain ATCC 51547 / Ice1) TaxID=498761 RepID=B0TH54_HELMI|nr:sensor histidine kinase [Heliomicrobium modesticaldum]ABZ83379.1 sensor histidine kinase, putative [Heliomicrobium modesticaldum Ice1]
MPDASTLDKIVRQTIESIENAKEQIFAIAEDARTECSRLQKDLQEVREKAQAVIAQVDLLTLKERQARLRLVEVSRELKRYTEEDIRLAYEQARDIQVNLAVLREREGQLRAKRDELERRLRHLEGMVQRAEQLMNQVGVVLDFMGGNLKDLHVKMDEAQVRQQAALRIIMAQDRERFRLAREIHDGPAQGMNSLVLQVELCERLLQTDPGRVRRELQELKGRLRDSLKELRKILYDLRPHGLDDQGLIEAIRRYTADFSERTGLAVETRFFGQACRLERAYEVAIFRMIQEALQNVWKHAGAKRVQVAFEIAPQAVSVIVRDDGVGFDVADIFARPGDRFGLCGMRERAELLDGEWEVLSRPGQGTQIKFRIPLKSENDGE